MRKEYILFDLDGTLTDPKVGICTSAQYALADQGISVENIDDLTAFIGPPLQYSFQKFYEMDEEQTVRAVAKFRERMHDVGKFENQVYPGIPQMLQKLKAQGFHLAVASSKTEDLVKEILEHFELDQYFEVMAGSVPGEPDSTKEDVINDALNRLFHYRMIKKDSVIMVGDRCFDVDAAKEVGLTSVAVRYGYAPEGELEESEPDYIVSTVEELTSLLLSTQLQGEDFVMKEAEDHSTCHMDPKYFSTDDRKTGQNPGSCGAGNGGQDSESGFSESDSDSQASREASGDWKGDAKKQRSKSFQMVWAFLYPFLLFYVMGELVRQLLGYAVLY
ncbi:MAG: HAD hydrolase-like protein, partial [Lachnospiraceae bacterium]|nr:HAD hydrolase-like protein [Lachnospiraceae bacterium]